LPITAYKRPWRWFLKKKKQKEKSGRGRLWKTAAAVEITKDAARLLIYDFHHCLEKPAGFSTFTTGPTAIKLTLRLLVI
jgi:hypothetical protein